MPIFATAGASLFIGGPREAKSIDWVLADFTMGSFVEVNWVESLGSFGDEATEVTFDAIGEGRTQKLKGVRNAGNMEVVLGIDYSDAGQIALRAAELSPSDYSFRITFNDAPSGGTPSDRYFIAKVMTVREVLDTANSVMRLNATLAINSNVVRVNAA